MFELSAVVTFLVRTVRGWFGLRSDYPCTIPLVDLDVAETTSGRAASERRRDAAVNPATGLMMVGGIDTDGNMHGTDLGSIY